MQWPEVAGAAPAKEAAQDTATAPLVFVELARVTLASAVQSEEGLVPAGATGTVVHVWHGGAACEVEFTKPFRAISTVKARDIIA